MKISAVNSALYTGNSKNEHNSAAFKGFMGPSRTHVVSTPHWDNAARAACGTYHTVTTLTYYKFLDDKQDETNKVISENTYIRKLGIKPNPFSMYKYATVLEGNVLVKEIPLSAKDYYNYVSGNLQDSQKQEVQNKLKRASLRELV